MLRFKASFLGVFFALSTVCFADNFVSLKGDVINMDNQQKVVVVSDNVVIEYNDYSIDTQRFEYWQNTKQLHFPKPFHLTNNELTFDAAEFYYSVSELKGQAHDFSSQVERLKISGEYIEFGPEKIIIKNAQFTTCDNSGYATHYNVKAKTIYLYPQWGFFVAFNSKVYANFIPGYIPVPTYIYGSKQYSLVGSTTLIPDVGSNRIEGLYIKEKIGYFLNKNSTGTFGVGTSAKLGGFLGINHAVAIKDRHQVNARIGYTQGDYTEGHLLYKYKLVEQKKEKKKSMVESVMSNFSESDSDTLSDIKVLVQHREVENDIRVSYLPIVQFDTNKIPLKKNKYLTSSAIFGQVREERDPDLAPQNREVFTAWRSKFYGTLTTPFELSEKTNLSTDLSFYGNWYNTGDTWQRLFARFNFSWPTFNFQPEISYVKRLMPVVGDTPFEFEKNDALETDELGLVLKKTYLKTFLRLEANYNLESTSQTFSDNLRTLDIVSGYTLHCWRLSLRWKTQQQSVSFSIDLY